LYEEEAIDKNKKHNDVTETKTLFEELTFNYQDELVRCQQEHNRQIQSNLDKYSEQIKIMEKEVANHKKEVLELKETNALVEKLLSEREIEVSVLQKEREDIEREKYESSIAIQSLLEWGDSLRRYHDSVITNLTEAQCRTLRDILCEDRTNEEVNAEVLVHEKRHSDTNDSTTTNKENDKEPEDSPSTHLTELSRKEERADEAQQMSTVLDILLENARLAYEKGDQRSVHLQVLRSFLSALPHNLVQRKVGISTKTLAHWKKYLEESGNIPGTIPGSGAALLESQKEDRNATLLFEEIQPRFSHLSTVVERRRRTAAHQKSRFMSPLSYEMKTKERKKRNKSR